MRTAEEQVWFWNNRDKVKICKTCREFKEKTLEFWYKNHRRDCGLSLECRACRDKRLEGRTEKVCTWCKVTKPATKEFFYHLDSSTSLFTAYCKDCYKGYLEDNKEKIMRWAEVSRLRHLKPPKEGKAPRTIRIRQNGGKHTKQEIDTLLANQEHRCAYCQHPIVRGRTNVKEGYRLAHLDHIEPISKGGRNDIGNLVWACQPCNNRKSAKPLTQFLQEMGWK